MTAMIRHWTPLTSAAALPHLERAVEAFAGAVAAVDPGAPVPSCPGWDVRALADHLGNVHRWARAAIVEGHPDTAEVEAPDDRDALVAWYRDCAGGLLDTLRTTDPGTPCWAFGPKPRTVAFWFRRQAHETTMHHLDAALARGGPVPGLDPVLALDGVDEVVGLFFPRQVQRGRIAPLTRSVALRPADPPAAGEGLRWVVAGDGTGAGSAPDALADVEVTGPAQALLELLWHRRTPDDPDLLVTGDRAALDAVLAVALTP
jgi:uncharacterized protein (TIGR03083 family)